MTNSMLEKIEKSYDGNYIIVDGREYVCVDHMLATQQWLADEKVKQHANYKTGKKRYDVVQAA